MTRPRGIAALKDELATITPPRELPRPVSPVPPPAELIVSPLKDKRVKPVRYLVPGRIPSSKLILWAGRGGDGKSTLARSFAAALSAGRCAFGLTYPDPACGKVLIVAAEDGPEDTILPGLLAEGADVSKIATLEGVRRGTTKTDFTLSPDHVELVRTRLRAEPDVRLIVIDPIASFVGRAKVDDHRAAELRLVLDPLSELAESTGVTIIMIAHLNKSTGDAVDRIAGSAAYRDAVRAAYLVTPDPEDDTRRLLMPVKQNLPGFVTTSIPFGLATLTDAHADGVLKGEQFLHLGAEDRAAVRSQLRRVQFFTAVSIDADATLKAKKQDGTKVQKCKEWMRQFLARYAFPSKEIVTAAEKAGYTFDNQASAKAELKSEGVLWNENKGGKQWWSGLGEPRAWVLRPEPTPFSPSSPLSTLSFVSFL